MTKLMTVPRKVAVFETSYHQYEIGSERLSLKNKKKFARTLISLLSEERKNNYAPGEFHGLVSRARNVALPNIQAGDRLQEVAREVLEEWGKKNRVKVKIYWKRVVIGKIIICPHSAKNEYMNYMIAEIDWPKLQKTD